MNLVTPVAATAAIVVAGRMSQSKPVDIKIAIGTGAYAIGLSLIAAASHDLAKQFAVLVLVLAAFRYVPDIAKKTGLSGGT
jgi:hypothetical protein